MRIRNSKSDIFFQQPTSLYPFPDDITIQDASAAATFAHRTYRQGVIPRCLVLWVDGSSEPGGYKQPSSAATGFHDPESGEWRESVTVALLNCWSSANAAELLAIREGFRQARALEERFDRLVLFSDSQAVLLAIGRDCPPHLGLYKQLMEDILEDANALYDLGVRVELHWVPKIAKVEGHVRVDSSAREYRKLIATLWPEIRSQCEGIPELIRIIQGTSVLTREDLRAKLPQRLDQANEVGTDQRNVKQLEPLEAIAWRRGKRIERRLKKRLTKQNRRDKQIIKQEKARKRRLIGIETICTIVQDSYH